ncbi:hypothetical protein PENTCL1PPCAC_19476, partial [Pristionchus entomophagus]
RQQDRQAGSDERGPAQVASRRQGDRPALSQSLACQPLPEPPDERHTTIPPAPPLPPSTSLLSRRQGMMGEATSTIPLPPPLPPF